MLAKALSNLLPPLSPDEQIAATKIHSLTNGVDGKVISDRPFRSPHHTASIVSIVGGSNNPKPGEISLAHTGVLFLDELPEYPRSVLEALRQPMEDRKIDISRANAHVSYPADFMLVGTMNPCPCGFFGDTSKECTCTSNQVLTYQKKLSGPLLDRTDLVVHVSRLPSNSLLSDNTLSNSQHLTAIKSIMVANSAQSARYKGSISYNASLTNRDIRDYAMLEGDTKNLLAKAADKLSLSARSYFKVIKVARTIADLEDEKQISIAHISEALQYRS